MDLPSHLSASSISRFHDCPYRWYCEKTKRPQIPTDDRAMLFGRAIHDIISNYYDRIDNNTKKEEISDILDEVFAEGENWVLSSFKAKTKRVRRNFEKIEINRIKKKKEVPTNVEKRFKIELFPEVPNFIIIPDAHYGDTGIIRDWKTGRNTEMNDNLIIQGKIYQIGMERLGHEVSEVIFNFLDNGTALKIPKVSDGYVLKKASTMCEMIKNDRFPSNYGDHCKWCPVILSCQFKNKCIFSR